MVEVRKSLVLFELNGVVMVYEKGIVDGGGIF